MNSDELSSNEQSLDLIINENNALIDNDIINTNIELIEELIPRLLFLKFQKNQINTIKDVFDLTPQKLAGFPGVGNKVLEQFISLKNDFKNEPDIFFAKVYQLTKVFVLPITEVKDLDFLLQFRTIIDDWLELNEKVDPRSTSIMELSYGLNGKERYKKTDLGLYLELTGERVRQLVKKEKERLYGFFRGTDHPYKNIKVDNRFTEKFIELEAWAIHREVVSTSQFLNEFSSSNVNDSPESRNYLELLFEILGGTLGGGAETRFTQEKIGLFSSKIPKSKFFRLGKVITDLLKESILPISEIDLVISVKKRIKGVEKKWIYYWINCLPEIISDGKGIYISFEKLSATSDMAVRVLFEIGQSQKLDDLVFEINQRLFEKGRKKVASRHSIRNGGRGSKLLESKGKTGYVTLKDWNENTDSISELIQQIFLAQKEPLSPKKIIFLCKSQRPKLNESSIRTIIGLDFLRIKNGKYIPKKWKARYSKEISPFSQQKPKENRIQLTKTLILENGGKFRSKDLVSVLVNEFNVSQGYARALIYNKNNFEVIREGKQSFITLAPDKPIKKASLAIDRQRNTLVEFLKSKEGEEYPLSLIVKELVASQGFPKPSVYKVININPQIFKKTRKGGKYWVYLRRSEKEISKTKDEWQTIKGELIHELEGYFRDSRQPVYNAPFQDQINLFVDLLKTSISRPELEGLEEQIKQNLFNYFFGKNNKVDYLNYLKQLSTSLDPFLQKVLFLVDETLYFAHLNSKDGLGKLIKRLNKLDPSENRYKKDLRQVPVYKFGKQMNSAYHKRNIVAHNAKRFSRQEIVDTIISTLVIYLYSVCEYHDEIKQGLTQFSGNPFSNQH